MFDKEAIGLLTKAEAITAARAALAAHVHGAVALPAEFGLQDIERFLPERRRLRATMTTSSPDDFAYYAKENAEEGARVFVDRAQMRADAVLNIGTVESPGHADHIAQLRPIQTASYQALLKVATGQGLTQQAVAEFMEDWAHAIECRKDGEPVETKQAIGAVRAITIEALNKLAAEVGQLSESRSTFDQVKATSDKPLPTLIEFTCEPYHGLRRRVFGLRLGILTGQAKPAITLRIVNAEQHAEEMAQELATLVASAIGDGMPVLVGSFKAGA